MISVTHFAFENIAISKVHAAQDGSDQDGEGQGQVRSMMLCFDVFSQRLFDSAQRVFFIYLLIKFV